jgi:5-methyltetrahydrofolate--homocysteine methyltransferase
VPDIPGLVRNQLAMIHNSAYAGQAAPELSVSYGSRGTPMVLSFFLGAQPIFGDDTVWYHPVTRDISTYAPRFDPDNEWLVKSIELFKAQMAALPMGVMPSIPGIGDYLTNLSGLRGVEELIFDCVDFPEEIHRIRELMLPAFVQCYRMFSEWYPSPELGHCTWLAWAPGTTYPVQCDFSTMLSPALFKELVMPELEFLKDHIEYMCWHLDGPDELKHLDLLLECPYLKAIQWMPGAGQKGVAHECWEPAIRKILSSGKALQIMTGLDDAIAFCQKYPHPGIYIRVGCRENAENLRKVQRDLGAELWT